MIENVSVQLGHMDLKDIGNPDAVNTFVASRAPRLNIDLNQYEIHVDKITGCVRAAMKMHSAEKANIIYDN